MIRRCILDEEIEEILEQRELQQKFYNQVFTSPLFLKKHLDIIHNVIEAREQVISVEEMRCR